VRIIGIDPGLARVGYGIIEVKNETIKCIKGEYISKTYAFNQIKDFCASMHTQSLLEDISTIFK